MVFVGKCRANNGRNQEVRASFLKQIFPTGGRASYQVGKLPGVPEKESYQVGKLPGMPEKESYQVGKRAKGEGRKNYRHKYAET